MRILVVEDEKQIRDFLKMSLEAECFAVDIAEDGEEGSYLARTNDYDVILLDNILPHKTGLEICQEIRENDITSPILMLSVKGESATKVDLLNAGADDYLTKPYSFQELLARIRSLLRRPKQIKHETLIAGELTLDSKAHVAMRGKKEIKLTRKEFMLLEYLMRNQGTVLSRGMIMEHVWDMNIDPFSNTIESHVLSLRTKLGSTKDKEKFIQTIPGQGYKIGAI